MPSRSIQAQIAAGQPSEYSTGGSGSGVGPSCGSDYFVRPYELRVRIAPSVTIPRQSRREAALGGSHVIVWANAMPVNKSSQRRP